MKNIFKILLCIIAITGMCFVNNNTVTAAQTKPAAVSTSQVINVSPLDVVNFPEKYLNKNISFNAEFVAYTSLGLDYKPAYKDPAKYIGVLIRRPDVSTNTIPLSEMKIFVGREIAEKNMELEAGDKIKITGKVFSNALGDPWVDVTSFDVTSVAKKTENNK